VFYVWFDALATYVSAVEGEGLWPADLHLIGKEILKFHTVFWPAFLMAAGWALPKKVFAHGWLLFENDKMSKSRGNIVRPSPISQVVGVDALRYFLLREIVFGQDGSFSFDALVGRYNSDLANGLGNLASRVLNMIHQYRDGYIPSSEGDTEVAVAVTRGTVQALRAYDAFDFSRALEYIWAIISVVDKFIVERAPWKLAKDSSDEAQNALDDTLYTVAEALRIVGGLVSPVMPHAAESIWRQLGFFEPVANAQVESLDWGGLMAGQEIGAIAPVFPRLDPKPTIDKMMELETAEKNRQAALFGRQPEPEPEPEAKAPVAPIAEQITIDDFAKVDLRVGEVKSAEAVKGADKLLQLQVDIGEAEPRTIVAGIALAYKPEQLVGRKVVIVANLQPRKLRGIVSHGMIVAASIEGGAPVLAGFLEDIPNGARLK
jgi:methionyl-tRNA synthetase